MRVLLSTEMAHRARGDAEPKAGLAVQMPVLQARGEESPTCLPPDFAPRAVDQ